jgi:hypothetical protein
MLRQTGSPLAIVNALALTLATLLAGAWDASGHGHDAAEANAAYCAVDHDVEATGATSRGTISKAAPLHDHSCVACKLGRSKIAEAGKASGTSPLDLSSAAARPVDGGKPRSAEYWRQTARGPPPG